MKIEAHSSIELLEPRVAPASVLSFTDVDGDKVKIISSAGDLNAPGVASFDSSGHQLQLLALTDPSFQGASIATTVVKSATGDGLVNIGWINAAGRDLGSVKIKGDLGRIFCGDADTSTAGLKLLDVRSMGIYGLATQGAGGGLDSSVQGRLGSLVVHGDVRGASVAVRGSVFNGVDGVLGAVRIGGSLIGDVVFGGGNISSTGNMGSVKIGGDVIGGSADFSGVIACGATVNSPSTTTLSSLTIGGSLIGGGGFGSGLITARNLGMAKIGGDVRGGSGNLSGFIASSVGIGTLKIGGSLLGGSIAGTDPALNQSGYIEAARIETVFIGGSVITGADDSTAGELTKNASIRVTFDIGSLTVKGSLIGTRGTDAFTEVVISAQGQATPAKGVDLAIGKISIGGRVDNTSILAGYDTNLSPQNGNASIGAVSVRGDWLAGNLVAGVLAGPGGFGAGGVVINNGSDAIIAKIASITIGGLVVGTPGAGDHFGFTAQQIGSFKSLGFVAPLKTGPSNDKIELSPTTGDVTIFEV